MRALILCAGLGARLRPITHSFPKHLIPILNKPVVQYGVESLIHNGIRDIGFIVNADYSQFYEIFGDGEGFGARFTYIRQTQPRGLGDAVKCGREFVGGEDFLVFLGDNFLKEGFTDLIQNFRQKGAEASIFLTRVEDPRPFGVATVVNGRIVKLQEKPAHPESPYVVVGAYMFKPLIFDFIDKLIPSARGELEITDAIQHLVETGAQVVPQFVTGWWRDTGRHSDIIEANRIMLEEIETKIEGTVDADSQIIGRVLIHPHAVIHKSRLLGPILIGEGSRVENSFVGPYTVMGKNTALINSEIEHSVVMAGSRIIDIESRIDSSLIGHSVHLSRRNRRPKSHQFIVGDNSQIILR